MMNQGSTLTFLSLIKQVNSIQIPILQRDYAQGRVEATEVRRQFLNSIKQALINDQAEHPLDLDFVYGNFEGSGQPSFSVLDGQQRLTTLFLLHWYLAFKDDRLELFQEYFVSENKAKFTYKTRVSATEFFNALSIARDISFNDSQSVADQLRDKSWFFLSWQFDPTVQACLTMIDSIHDNFSECEIGLYDRLINNEKPRIVFQYLNLESFGLSDELYIKMNARGKPLSDFENFKAWFCSKLEKSTKGKEIEKKLDQEWTDIFWKISLELNKSFDELYIKFFNLITFYSSCEDIEGSFDYLEKSKQFWLNKLRRSSGYVPTDDFDKFDSFNDAYLINLESLLDFFSLNLMNKHVMDILKGGLSNDDYINQIKFYSYVKYIQSIRPIEMWSEFTETNLSQWIRVTDNLINNHRIDEMAPFVASIKSISELSSHCENLYSYLADVGFKSGFTKEQRDEEASKAKLILIDQSWEPLLITFEQQTYLQGKVDFLLEMSTNEFGVCSKVKFEELGRKVGVLLGDEMLRSDEFLLQRALLSLGDYLVYIDYNRSSFCTHYRNTYRERSENWFRVVKEPTFRNLLSIVDNDVYSSLNQLIEKTNCGGWRQLIVNYPEVFDYCQKKLIFKENGLIHLLSKSTLRGYHAELRTFILDIELKKLKEMNILEKEISSFNYVEVYGYDTPYIRITLNEKNTFKIAYIDNNFKDIADQEIPKNLSDLFSKLVPI